MSSHTGVPISKRPTVRRRNIASARRAPSRKGNNIQRLRDCKRGRHSFLCQLEQFWRQKGKVFFPEFLEVHHNVWDRSGKIPSLLASSGSSQNALCKHHPSSFCILPKPRIRDGNRSGGSPARSFWDARKKEGDVLCLLIRLEACLWNFRNNAMAQGLPRGSYI